MRVGVVGDIHGNYRELQAAVKDMGELDHLLFTGDGYRDITRLQDETGLFVEGVLGNCDFCSTFPAERIVYLDHHKILVTHGHLYGVKQGLNRISLAAREQGAELVVFGHTHQPLESEWQGIRLFNPGTLSRERSYRGTTYGIIEVSETGLNLYHCKI